MAVFKCKMCGGDLCVDDNITVAECEYCGTKQTVSYSSDEKRINLFNRANHLRINSEFDKAANIYENIVAEYPEDAEGYWGLVICNYGIEYVDDPATSKKIPTCHRASFEAIQSDENYKKAIEYADATAQKIYRDEAREIERIREEILSISENEKPYDVFICYKETNVAGGRTHDSVYAQDIYNALSKEGYRVFFSRITLEDKLGNAYEPYIFSALNSAKVMLVVGTTPENFNSVWIKNEWSRYLALIKSGKNKTIIPIYKNMSPYDLPKELSYLQAQDMSKIGFMQDLLYGVKKILDFDACNYKDIKSNTLEKNVSDIRKEYIYKKLDETLKSKDVIETETVLPIHNEEVCENFDKKLKKKKRSFSNKKKNKGKIFLKISALLITISIIVAIVFKIVIPNYKFHQAMKLIEAREYKKAYISLQELKGNKKAEQELENFQYKLMSVCDENERVLEKYSYDNSGNCVYEYQVYYDDEGYKLYENTIRKTYDERNNCIYENKVCYSNGTETTEEVKNTFDENNLCIRTSEKTKYSDRTTNSYYNYEYDKNGNCIKQTYSTSHSTDTYIILYFYDENGNRKLTDGENSGGEEFSISYEYDREGNCTKKIETTHHEKGIEENIYEYFYDEKGNLIKEQWSGTYPNIWLYKYENGKCIEKSDAQGNRVEKYFYDSNGNKEKEVISWLYEGAYWSEENTFLYELLYVKK